MLARALGLEGKPVTRVENYCATGSEALRNAAYAVASGAYDCVMAIGVEKLKDSGYSGLVVSTPADDGSALTVTAPASFSFLAPAYANKYGVDPVELKDVLTRIAWKNHRNGALNPRAQFKKEVSKETIACSPIVAGPLGIFDCSGVSDGSAAAIIVRAEEAHKYPDKPLDVLSHQLVGLLIQKGRWYLHEVMEVFKNAPQNLAVALQGARAHGDATFLLYEGERYSFARVMDEVDGLAHLLVNTYGVKKGDRVAVAMRNYPEWVMSFAAIISSGAINVSMNSWWTEDEMDFALEDSGATVLICDQQRYDIGAASCAKRGVKALVVRSDKPLPAGVDKWEEVLPLGDKHPGADIHPDEQRGRRSSEHPGLEPLAPSLFERHGRALLDRTARRAEPAVELDEGGLHGAAAMVVLDRHVAQGDAHRSHGLDRRHQVR